MIERILTDNWDDYRKDARDYILSLVLNKNVVIKTHKGESGRYLAEVHYPTDDGMVDLASHLMERGMAVEYKG